MPSLNIVKTECWNDGNNHLWWNLYDPLHQIDNRNVSHNLCSVVGMLYTLAHIHTSVMARFLFYLRLGHRHTWDGIQRLVFNVCHHMRGSMGSLWRVTKTACDLPASTLMGPINLRPRSKLGDLWPSQVPFDAFVSHARSGQIQPINDWKKDFYGDLTHSKMRPKMAQNGRPTDCESFIVRP